MKTKWNPSLAATVSRAIGAGVSLGSETDKLSKPGSRGLNNLSPKTLKVLGEKVLIEEDPMEPTADIKSGLSKEVVEMLSSGSLLLPDDGKYFWQKFPFRGVVLSTGERVKKVKIGDRVQFAELGGQRFEFENKQYLIIHEWDIHGVFE